MRETERAFVAADVRPRIEEPRVTSRNRDVVAFVHSDLKELCPVFYT